MLKRFLLLMIALVIVVLMIRDFREDGRSGAGGGLKGGSELSGTYEYDANWHYSELRRYPIPDIHASVTFKNASECTYYQNGRFYDGRYFKTDEGYRLEINVSGSSGQVFTAEIVEDGIIMSGGIFYKHRFDKVQ